MARLEGLPRKVSAGYRESKWQDKRQMHLLGPVGGALWGSRTRDRLFNANQKNEVLVNSIVI